MRFGVGLLLAFAGCYDPTAQPGLPCSADLMCPGDQVCDVTVVPPTCTGSAATDAGLDGPPLPPPCATDVDCPTPEAPICGPEGSCRGCVADSECPSDVCHELAGTCIDEAAALYVAPAAIGMSCTRTAPCGSIDLALVQRTDVRTTVKVADGTYAEGFELLAAGASSSGETPVVISGADRSWEGATIELRARVTSGLTAVLEGLTIDTTSGDGLVNRGTTTVSRCLIQGAAGNGIGSRLGPLRVLDSRIESNSNAGILIEDGTLELVRTTVIGNGGTGVYVQGAGFTIVNTIIAGNGLATSSGGGARLNGISGQPAVFRYNTVALNRGTSFLSSGIQCEDSTTIENTIIADNEGAFVPQLSSACNARHSLFAQDAPQGMGNKQGSPRFASMTDFHILPGSAAIDGADDADADAELLDVDGQPRPAGAGPDIGADELY